MTSTTVPQATTLTTTTSVVDEAPAKRRGLNLSVLAGAASITAPLLLAVAGYTTPPQTSDSNEAYVASLAADPTMTAISANFYHYSLVLSTFAALAAIGLVRGRRGRGLAVVGGLLAAFGAIQLSGLVYNDWWLAALGNELSVDRAAELFGTMGDPSVTVWLITGQLLPFLGFPVLYAGLARAGVISWWLVPVSLFPMVAFGLIGGVAGLVVGTACAAPAFVTGWRLIQRGRLAA